MARKVLSALLVAVMATTAFSTPAAAHEGHHGHHHEQHYSQHEDHHHFRHHRDHHFRHHDHDGFDAGDFALGAATYATINAIANNN